MMNELLNFLDKNNIQYSTQLNKDNETVIDFLSYEILQDENDFCVAATNTMNFMWMSLAEVEEWLMNFYV